MRRLQRMAVRTQNAQVLETIVVMLAINVIELDGHTSIGRLLGPATQLACALFKPCADQALSQIARRRPPVSHQNLGERTSPRWAPATVPSLAREVRRVDVEPRDLACDVLIVAASSDEPERTKHTGYAARAGDSPPQIIVGPSCRGTAFREMRDVQT
ncbi:MAG: hypothetical protein SFX73_36600 [Kofleriaceae bacterium]|nr:hypothetical protein [Kofleriaceae bacterium]